jgi:hypothetical protein
LIMDVTDAASPPRSERSATTWTERPASDGSYARARTAPAGPTRGRTPTRAWSPRRGPAVRCKAAAPVRGR